MSVSAFPYGTIASKALPQVSARADGRYNISLTGTVYSGLQFQDDGDEYEYNSAGGLTNLTTWLDSGSSSDVWVQRIITSGSFNDFDSGSGRLQMSSARTFRVSRAITGVQTCIAYFQFWSASSGGTLLQQTSSSTWTAEKDFDPCPLCCFTPNTLILMASGLQMPISKIREGDAIAVVNPNNLREIMEERVTGVITRSQRAMYRLHFSNGSTIEASDDHPFHVMGKGPASLNHHDTEYKDLGYPETLLLGDTVYDESGNPHQLVHIEKIDYDGLVYTLENSLFFAGGLLVY